MNSILPPELLEQIFQDLSRNIFQTPAQDSLWICSHVSRHWRAVALRLRWRDLALHSVSLRTLRSYTKFLTTSRASGYDYISFVRSVHIGSWRIQCECREIVEVTSEIVKILEMLSETQLHKIVIYSPGVASIWPGFLSTSSIFTTLVPRIKSLVSLEIKGVYKYGDPAIELLRHLPPSMKTLVLESSCLNRTIQPLPFVHIFSLPNIRNFTLINSNLRADALSQALRAWGSQLRRLSLHSCNLLHDERVITTLVSCCPGLTTFEIVRASGGSGPYEEQPIKSASIYRLLSACPALETMICSDFPKFRSLPNDVSFRG